MNNSRIPFLIGLAILVSAGISAALYNSASRFAPTKSDEPSIGAGVPDETIGLGAVEGSLDGSGDATDTDEFGPERDLVFETPLIVDSFQPVDHTALDGWTFHQTSAGHFDGLYATEDGSPLGNDVTVEADATVIASGWSGDFQLGLKFDDIVLSQCGRIIARTRSVLERHDVAKNVHPNLDRSGWEAVIHAGDLALCADPAIRAWAVLPGQPPRLLPLKGEYRLSWTAPATETAYRVPALPVLLPEDVEPPSITDIEVTGARVNLRRCGGLKCPRVGQVDGGRHRVHVADKRDGWTLLIFADRAGWISDPLYGTAE